MALKSVYSGSALQVEGLFAQGRCTMIHQPQQNRYCINMVYASPIRRGRAEIIEDIVPLYDITVEAKLPENISRIYLPLTGEELTYTVDNGTVKFTLPKLHCHAVIVVEYK